MVILGLGVLVLLVTAMFSGGDGRVALGRNDPRRRVVESLTAMEFPSQLTNARPLCTGQGIDVLECFSTNSGEFMSTFTLGRAKVNPHLCDVEMSRDTVEGRTVIFLRLVEEKGMWKFQDSYLVQANGRPIKLWMSMVMAHPFISFAYVYSDEIVKAAKATGSVIKFAADVAAPWKVR